MCALADNAGPAHAAGAEPSGTAMIVSLTPVADRIIVLQNGEVSETGTFESLMEKSGLFVSMMSKQQAG